MSARFNDLLMFKPVEAWMEVWHVWFVMIPRRTITGRLAYGRVWRRWDGRHWTYKRIMQWKA